MKKPKPWQPGYFAKTSDEEMLWWFEKVGLVTKEERDNPYWKVKGWGKEDEDKAFADLKKDMKQKRKEFDPLWVEFETRM